MTTRLQLSLRLAMTTIKVFKELAIFLFKLPRLTWNWTTGRHAVVNMPAFQQLLAVEAMNQRNQAEFVRKCEERKRDRILNPQKYFGKEDDVYDL